MALRENSVTPRLINHDYNPAPAEKGAIVDIPIPSAVNVADVTPAMVAPAATDMTPGRARLALDQWREASLYVTDRELQEIAEGTIPMQATEAVKALANDVDRFVLGLYRGVYGWSGTSGATPFAATTAEFAGALQVLQDQLCPMDQNIRAVVGTAAWANAIQLRAFQDASWGGGPQGLVEAQIGRKMGADWWVNQNVPTHTRGTMVNGAGDPQAEVTATVDAGATTFGVDDTTLTGTIVPGDVFTVAGDTQTYVVTNATALTAIANAITGITFAPAAQQQWDAASVISVMPTHLNNMVFHRDAFAFASRPLAAGNVPALGADMDTIVDPISGIVLRVEMTRHYKQTRISYDILYGATIVRPQLACRLVG